MGQQFFSVDAPTLGAVADRFDYAADLISHAARLRLGFDGSCAGRVHTAQGEALRRTLDRWGGELTRWARASTEIATALRLSSARYGRADLGAADRVG